MHTREIIRLIERNQKERKSIYHETAAKYGLSETTLWILCYISEFDEDQTQQDLCRQGFYAKQTINTAIAGLVADGFAELIPIPGTRGHKRIHLTPNGQALADRTARPLKAAEENAYGKLSEDELRVYLETLRKLNVYLREETAKLGE